MILESTSKLASLGKKDSSHHPPLDKATGIIGKDGICTETDKLIQDMIQG